MSHTRNENNGTKREEGKGKGEDARRADGTEQTHTCIYKQKSTHRIAVAESPAQGANLHRVGTLVEPVPATGAVGADGLGRLGRLLFGLHEVSRGRGDAIELSAKKNDVRNKTTQIRRQGQSQRQRQRQR